MLEQRRVILENEAADIKGVTVLRPVDMIAPETRPLTPAPNMIAS
jgi:hypothetical protein